MEISEENSRKNNGEVLQGDNPETNGRKSVEENVMDFFNKRVKEIAEEEAIALDDAKELLEDNFSVERIAEIIEVEKAAKKRNYNIPQCGDCNSVYNGRKFVPLSDEEKKYLKRKNMFFSPAYCKPCVKKIRTNLRKR